jgi:hypothetical protein
MDTNRDKEVGLIDGSGKRNSMRHCSSWAFLIDGSGERNPVRHCSSWAFFITS